MTSSFLDVVSNTIAGAALPLVERGFIPDSVLRTGMRFLLGSTLNESYKSDEEFASDLKSRPIAESTKKANDQHYEVPHELYDSMLGPWLKYSSGYWNSPDDSLERSETQMLELMCARAELENPRVTSVLDLGCGWGSAALFIAKKYPNVQVTCVSNSNSQREYIAKKAEKMGLKNVTPVTQDANEMTFPKESFDRVVSNEMLEHMKNYELFFERIASWLKKDGKIFIHIFTNKDRSYHFEKGWMAENFFTGGTMPSQTLITLFQKDLVFEERWVVNGNHYSKTLEAWLKRLDDNRDALMPWFEKTYGKGNGYKWYVNWRLFNMACSELFKYDNGETWFVSHYRFHKR